MFDSSIYKGAELKKLVTDIAVCSNRSRRNKAEIQCNNPLASIPQALGGRERK